ncbi:TetR/AcrR family transcriptional regulator [Actinotalea sp. M2MS4P-6]|uniref:TetR/AcrR family transcriptional regulator n=1 Tax=Actinotalea sp. M2MS4P-6 TaxID=2983762 RepID=UPI0021E3987F|nr:TetR/AcrR family transcriptional regulator [Actinotalea sp. M2MS4P-6]MCV2394291.1 TetR/AcrR family transcriptional regulator [Actinotalea sp. M2MS4P-6]
MPDRPQPASRADGYATGRATKRAIVARAAEAFAQKGFYGASLRSIAREADVDHSTLLHHFGTKTALLLAVIEWYDTQNAPPTPPTEMSADAMLDGLVATAAHNAAAPGLVQLLSTLTAEAGSADHPARRVLQERHETVVGLIGRMIEQQRDAGVARDDGLDPAAHAALVVATWEGLQVYDALHPGEIDVPDLLARTLRDAFGLTQGGTAPDGLGSDESDDPA